MERSEGFPPIAREDARILILGSLPGRRSISEQQYYAHPRNAFWPIMHELFGIVGTYEERCHGLMDNGIALWDVLRASIRRGSLDSDISLDTAVGNEIAGFASSHCNLRTIAFNGKKAEQLFARFVELPDWAGPRMAGLPSTSPAYAAMPFSGKLEAWKNLLQG